MAGSTYRVDDLFIVNIEVNSYSDFSTDNDKWYDGLKVKYKNGKLYKTKLQFIIDRYSNITNNLCKPLIAKIEEIDLASIDTVELF